MGWMYCISGWMADYYHWWERRVEANPRRWQVGLLSAGAILTFLPAFLGTWAFALWPIGWVALPGLWAADRQLRRAREIQEDQRAAVFRTKKLISLGQKEMKR